MAVMLTIVLAAAASLTAFIVLIAVDYVRRRDQRQQAKQRGFEVKQTTGVPPVLREQKDIDHG